ncbi:hypothetical protein D3C80_1848440 [compost metagenome]
MHTYAFTVAIERVGRFQRQAQVFKVPFLAHRRSKLFYYSATEIRQTGQRCLIQ